MNIKICGIQDRDTLLCCEKNNVNFFGMIFYEKSPRNISFENAIILQKISKDLNIKGVGVFVNKNIYEIEEIIKNLKLRFVQLHGSEDDEYVKNLKQTGVKIIKSISISNKNDLRIIDKYKNVDYYLFDYKPLKDELPGGNSKSFDWNILRELETKKPLLEKFPTAEALETFITDRILSIAQDDDQTDNESSGAHMVENEIMLPREWEMHKDENTGELYYINSRTQERTKEKPGQ